MSVSGKLSISMQRQCVEHLLALADADESIMDGARQAALTLGWIERRQELLRALIELEQRAPELVELFQAFPGATITDVRG